ncbi:MAG: hypothetical protein VKS61_13410 [Candidatus Sericytochromatia bacterium]|nr:hypothetical protein [Candidatus Sericytochromatia bacterium]
MHASWRGLRLTTETLERLQGLLVSVVRLLLHAGWAYAPSEG